MRHLKDMHAVLGKGSGMLCAERWARLAVIALFCAVFLLCAGPASSAAAERVTGRAFVGGSWMVGGQSYFSVTILGHSTVGWCMNRGAAEPLQGWYAFSADRTISGPGGSTDLWLEGSFEPVAYDARSGMSCTQDIVFMAGTENARWDVTAPAGCTLHVDNRSYPAGTAASVAPGQRVSLSALDPASLGNAEGVVSLAGSAHADATTVETYRNIVITPPGAWDGISYAYGLPAGYQRVGVGPITIERPRSATVVLDAAARFSATVRYFVDGEREPCFSERVPAQSTFQPAPAAALAARKPNCTPGLDAWYLDRPCRNLADAFVVSESIDVYGQNLATLSYAPSPASGFQHETIARKDPRPDADLVSLSSTLPSSRIVAWGTQAALARTSTDPLYEHDGSRWRTLRRPDDGWHLAESALDDAIGSVRIEQDLTVYDYWTKSTFDGVLDW